MCNSTNPTFPTIEVDSDKISRIKPYAENVNNTLSHKDIDYLKNCYSTILTHSKYKNQGNIIFLHPVAHLFYELFPYDVKIVRNYGKILNIIDNKKYIDFLNFTCYLNNKKNYNCKVEMSKALFNEGKRNESISILKDCVLLNKIGLDKLCFIELIHQYKLINQHYELEELVKKVISKRKSIENDIDIITTLVDYYISKYQFADARNILTSFKDKKNKNKINPRILSYDSSYNII